MEIGMPVLDFLKSKKIVGLDIGSFALKLVELKPRKKGKDTVYELVSLGYEPVPYQSIVEGSIMDSTAVVDAIQHIFYESKNQNQSALFRSIGQFGYCEAN